MKKSELKALIREVIDERNDSSVDETTSKVWEQVSELRDSLKQLNREEISTAELRNNHMRLASACKRYLEEFNNIPYE